MQTILLQGDSVTDARRDRKVEHIKGYGYATILTGWLNYNRPLQYNIVNRGVSGNRTSDVLDRFDEDILAVKPDYMSLLVGVNDVWHRFQTGNGLTLQQTRDSYDSLLYRLRAELPNTKVFAFEPFVLDGSATHLIYQEFRQDLDERAAVMRTLAAKYSVPFVPLQELFDKRQCGMPDDYWLRDGVHPTCAGAQLITEQWLKTFDDLK